MLAGYYEAQRAYDNNWPPRERKCCHREKDSHGTGIRYITLLKHKKEQNALVFQNCKNFSYQAQSRMDMEELSFSFQFYY